MGAQRQGTPGEGQGMHNRGESSELVRYTGNVRSMAGDGQMHRRCQKRNFLCMAGRPLRMVVRSNFHRQNEFRESAIRAQQRHEGDQGQEGKISCVNRIDYQPAFCYFQCFADQAVDISRRHQTQHR